MRASLPGCAAKGHQFLRMDDSQPQFLEAGAGTRRRRIAYRRRGGKGPPVLWLSGFLSDMASTKATVVAAWAAEQGLAMMRFDYSGHGLSGGDLLNASIGAWLEESMAVWELMGGGPRIVIGSSMGGWIALLLARHLAGQGRTDELAGLVLIAPAFDMTEALMWRELPPEAKDEIAAKGVTYVPSAYGDPYPITRHLIEEGRAHLLEGHPFDPGCPSHPARHARSRRSLAPCSCAGRSAGWGRCRADADQGRRPSPVRVGGLATPHRRHRDARRPAAVNWEGGNLTRRPDRPRISNQYLCDHGGRGQSQLPSRSNDRIPRKDWPLPIVTLARAPRANARQGDGRRGAGTHERYRESECRRL